MKNHSFKKLISAFLAIIMLAGLMAYIPGGFITASAATYESGKCGENLTWELDGSTNKLTIRGRGEMYNYTPENSAPWGTYISEVDISPYVTSIGDYAFYGFYNTTSITIPNGVTSIGKYAFAGYSGLTSITIPSSVKSIGYSAFENCLSLTRVNTTSIAAWCEIVFSNSYSNPLSYAHNLYLNSNTVKNLVLPEGISQLNDYVFYGFSGLVSVTIPNDVFYIGAYAFYGCDHLTNVTIPSSVMSIGNSAFEGCSALAWVNTTDVVSWCGTVFGNYYSNPLNYAHGFYLNSNIVKDLIIPDGVTRINAYAFFGCTGLTSIMIPESVTDIGVYAFHYYDYYWGDDPRPLDATLKVYKDSYAQRYAVNNQFEYEVQKRLQRIEVTVRPTKTSYIKGETLDVSGGRITLYYDNGSSEAIAISSSMVSGFDSGVVGTQTLTVTYNGRTAFFNVTVIEDAVKGMVITSAPTKTVYQVGETLALNGCKVRITYNSGAVRTARIIDEAGVYKIVFDDNSERDTITVSGYNRLKNGNQTITISYSGVSASFIIEMNGTAPKGDPDCDGQITVADALVALRVAAKLSESSPEMVACCDTDGDGHITVADALAILRVAAKLAPPFDLIILVRIAVTTLPSKTSYISGEALDITGCKITLYYSDGSSEIVAVSDSMVSGFSSSTTGTKTLTVTYEGKTATFTVTVVAKSLTSITITAKPTKTSYVVGQSLDVTGGKITAYYNDGSSEVINMTASMVSGFSSSTVGTKTLTVTYSGKTTAFTVTVIEKSLSSIAVTTWPNKTTYIKGESLDVTGGKITLYYNDGSSEVMSITTSMVSGFNSSTTGTKTLTVTYKGNTATFAVTIVAPTLTRIAITTLPNKMTYIKGESLDVTGGKITLYYNDGSSEVINITAAMVSGFNSSTTGTKTLTVTFGGKTATFDIEVFAANQVTSGTCGDNLTWLLDGAGNLTISGTGDMYDYGYFDPNNTVDAPWGKDIKKVTINEGVTSIGRSAFGNCQNLNSITIPDSVTRIGSGSFSLTGYYNNASNWENGVLYIGKWLITTKNYEMAVDYRIKNGTIGIADDAFGSNTKLTSVTIPDSVRTIGNSAFYYNTKLTSVIIPGSVSIISDSAFRHCSSLTSVTIQDGVTCIGWGAFMECTSLMDISIPDSVIIIDTYAFSDCTSLPIIRLPDNLDTISYGTFMRCSGLTRITIPNGVTTIDDFAFYGCTGLINATIPESVTSVGNVVFYNCENLTSITIPSSMKRIPHEMFFGCKNLTSVELANVEYIDFQAFAGCAKLTNITLPDCLIDIEAGAFSGCTSLKSIALPSGVKAILGRTFEGCTSLTSVSILGDVHYFSESAFSGCTNLTSIVLPNDTRGILDKVFADCVSLTSLVIPRSVESISSNAFDGCTNLTLLVYRGSYAYQYAIDNGIKYTII